jgi:hypothetical protein
MKHIAKIKEYQLSQIFFWLFLLSIPWNKRIIYNPGHAYIDGYFSYYLAFFLYLSDIFLFLGLAVYIVESRGKWNIRALHKMPLFRPIFGLFVIVIAGLFHMQQSLTWHLYSFLKVFEVILAIWFVSRETYRNPRVAAILLYISGVFQAILGIWQFHVQHIVGFGVLGEYISPLGTGGLATIATYGGKLTRSYGTFPHPNILGFFLSIALVLGYFLIVSRETSQKARKFLIIGDYLLIVGIFLTFSRVSWAIAALATICILWYLKGKGKWLRLAIFLPAIVSCVTILIFWHGLLFNRVTNIETSNSYTQRVELDQAGIKIFGKVSDFWYGMGELHPHNAANVPRATLGISTVAQYFYIHRGKYRNPGPCVVRMDFMENF